MSIPDKFKKTVEYVNRSDLFNGFDKEFDMFFESGPDCTWGDNSHSMNTIRFILDTLDNDMGNVSIKFLNRCRDWGCDTFVDFEN